MAVDYSVYLVTDSTPAILGDKDLISVVEASLRGGVTVVQYRDKHSAKEDVVAVAKKLHQLTQSYGVPLLINDRVDVAVEIGCEGVHIGQDDMGEYDKKDTKSIIGPSGVADILAALDAAGHSSIPAVCIGGVNASNASAVLAGSASPHKALDGLAVVSAIIAAADPAAASRDLLAKVITAKIPDVVAAVGMKTPLSHNMTNLVVQNFAANVALCVGASPIMSNYAQEAPDLARLGGALVLNMGTVTPEGLNNYAQALKAYNQARRPVVLDPVGAGATSVRREAVQTLLASGTFAVIKGNQSEIQTVHGASVTQRGVDSSSSLTVPQRARLVRSLARQRRCVVLLTGPTDLISDGRRTLRVDNGHGTLFGGPSQPEPLDERGGIRAAQRLAQTSDSATINPNQYENDNNWKSHVKWTGPQILRQLPEINIICAGMGTSGTMTGLGTYFKEAKPSVFRLGVCTAAGDRVPGPRSYALLAPVEFPWKAAVDHIEEVGSHDSYSLSLDMIREGLVCGPSSGFNLKGLFQFIEKRKAEGNLSQLAGSDGEIHCAFLCCDLPYQYVSEYFDKLGESFFPSIKNEELLGVDVYRYDEAWERDAADALAAFFGVSKTVSGDVLLENSTARPKSETTIIDLRQAADFEEFHVPGSTNVPFVQADQPSPFSDPSTLKGLWTRLEETFKVPHQDLQSLLHGKRVLLLCYDGDSSRVANSVLRAKGYETDSIRGGFKVLHQLRDEAKRSLANATQQQGQMWLRLSSETEGITPSQPSQISVSVQPLGSASG
ncbi:cysteine synthase B, partial [Metarhizium majus ARSEF 297]